MKDTCKRAIEKYGFKSQADMMIEECAELIAAIQRYKRDRTDERPILEEMADVAIMLEQMKIYFAQWNDTFDKYEYMKKLKLNRLKEKLDKEIL